MVDGEDTAVVIVKMLEGHTIYTDWDTQTTFIGCDLPIVCDPACVRGTCTEDRVCVCPEGWTGENCNTRSKRTIVMD